MYICIAASKIQCFVAGCANKINNKYKEEWTFFYVSMYFYGRIYYQLVLIENIKTLASDNRFQLFNVLIYMI